MADTDERTPADPRSDVARPASRRLALAAFFALVTALLLPWWSVTWSDGQVATDESVRVFRPEPPLTTTWGPWLTGLLVVAAIGLLFVRIAARSDKHEPPAWRRDVGLAAGLSAAALVSASLWPAAVPSFWGGRIYTAENVTTQVTEVAEPLLGWWLVVLGLVLLGFAAFLARPAQPQTPK